MSDYGYKECTECEGTGDGYSCCGDEMHKTDDNNALCPTCKEHTETNCAECEGEGKIPRTFEDHQDELDYWAEMRADEKRHEL